MRRALFFLLLLAVIAGLSAWAADQPGRLVLDWGGWRVETSLPVLVVLAGIAVVLAFWSGRLWTWMKSGHALAPERRAARRARAGMRDVNRALVALAAGDVTQARKLAGHAVDRLDGAPIAHVIAAQAAATAGDDAGAQRHFEALAADRHAKFLGLRGLIAEARRQGRTTEALALVADARAAVPDSEWAVLTAFEVEAQAAEWAKAEASLKRAVNLGIIGKDAAARHYGALYYGRAVEAETHQDAPLALKYAMAAHRRAPDFAPASVLAARLLKAAGKAARAARLIENTWALAPHPALAESYASLYPTETASTRLARFERLAAQKPDHPESRLRLAEAQLGAGAAGAARQSLKPLTQGAVRARAARLMLQVEANTGGSAAERAHWSDIAANGAAEPLWTCNNCQTERARWTPHCPSCGQFNSLEWDRAPGSGHGPAASDAIALIGTSRPKPPFLPAPGEKRP